jgi:hypothetical protein
MFCAGETMHWVLPLLICPAAAFLAPSPAAGRVAKPQRRTRLMMAGSATLVDGNRVVLTDKATVRRGASRAWLVVGGRPLVALLWGYLGGAATSRVCMIMECLTVCMAARRMQILYHVFVFSRSTMRMLMLSTPGP